MRTRYPSSDSNFFGNTSPVIFVPRMTYFAVPVSTFFTTLEGRKEYFGEFCTFVFYTNKLLFQGFWITDVSVYCSIYIDRLILEGAQKQGREKIRRSYTLLGYNFAKISPRENFSR